MPQTITQKVLLKGTTPDVVYTMYLTPKHHTALTGSTHADISAKQGTSFELWDGYITGKNLQLVKDRLIVQAWRGSDWNDNDADSTFMLLLEKKDDDVLIHMTHANIPDEFVKDIKKGWTTHYWKPWQKYLDLYKGK